MSFEYCSRDGLETGERKKPIMTNTVMADNGMVVSDCQHCGGTKTARFNFCPNCGTPLKNEPLTLEELIEFHIKRKGFYIDFLDGGLVMPAFADIEEYFSENVRVHFEYIAVWSPYKNGKLYFYNYGKTWLAYRHKPEETKND